MEHGTITRTGIIYKKIPCCMRNTGGLLLKILKYFEVMLNIFEFSHVKKKMQNLDWFI